jgi:hypothetical protein
MKKYRYFKVTCLFLIAISTFCACKKDEPEIPEVPVSTSGQAVYKWYQSDSETRSEFETGVRWYFSHLGAELTDAAWKEGITWTSETEFELNFEKLGFNPSATEVLNKLAKTYQNHEQYQKQKSIDFGSFVLNTLNNSNHYYAIVGMPSTLNEFKRPYQFTPKEALISPSSVSFEKRLISFPKEKVMDLVAFISEEIKGDVAGGNYQVLEHEVIDVMKNGELRYGVYQDGKLHHGAKPKFSAAGKPTKCMWCHESKMLPTFNAAEEKLPNYFNHNEFNDSIKLQNNLLTQQRKTRSGMVNFSNKQGHVEMELIYIRYMNPSPKRLASEWNMTENEVKMRLMSLSTYQHHEFKQLGQVYNRNDVLKFAPFLCVETPKEPRNTEENQPQFLP